MGAQHISAVAQPGDTVLIGFDRTLTDEELADLREQFEKFLDTTKVHLAFVEHVTSMVVVKGPERDANEAPLRRETLEGYEAEGER